MRIWIPIVAIVGLGMPLLTLAQQEHPQPLDADRTTAAKPEAAKTAASPVSKQTTCPVTGKPINQDFSADHEGHKVYFCSKGCISKFKERRQGDPPALYAQWYPQSVQTQLPGDGRPG